MVIKTKAVVTVYAVFGGFIILDDPSRQREIKVCSIGDTVANGLLSGNQPNDGKKRRENR
jgi:hypothetical protein